MAINRTPVLKRCRQLGLDPSVLGYSSKKESIRQPKRRRKESEYGMQLREKQKAKFIYGVLEKQFLGYFKRAKAMPGITGDNLMRILESRLDNVVFRLGFAKTRKDIPNALRAYARLARLSAALVEPGGFLFIASCSHHAEAGAFFLAVAEGLVAWSN